MITELLTRIRFLLFRKKSSEFDDELQFHIEQSTAAKTEAGLPFAEARRQALIEFGAVEAAREQTDRQRPGWWAGIISQDVRYAMRTIAGNRWFSAAIVVTLALGIGLNTMVFTLVNAVLLKPVPVPNGERLVTVMASNKAGSAMLSYPDFLDYRAQSKAFDAFNAVDSEGGVLSEPGNPPQPYALTRVTAGILSMVEARAVLGRTLVASDEQAGAAPVVVIGYKVWQERYAGVGDVIGRTVQVNRQPATIVGVMPKGFRFPDNADLWMPLVPTPELARRENRTLIGYAILKRGVSLQQAGTELKGICSRLAGEYPEDKDVGVSVMTFNERYNGGSIRMVFLLMMVAVGFVLLIACADVANMMLSRSLGRQREMSIRTALGATRWRIVRQMLMESVLLSVMGGVLGLGLAAGGIHWFDKMTDGIRPYWIQFTMSFPVFGYFAALCILTGLLFGIAPALRSSKSNPNDALKEGAHSVARRGGGWLTSGLVVFQFALTLVLLTGAGIFVRGMLDRLAVNPFIPASQISTGRVHLPKDRYKDVEARIQFYDQLLPRLQAIPGATHAGIASASPGLGAATEAIEIENMPVAEPAQRPRISFVAESPGYFETIHLPLLQGRDFNNTDGSANHEAAILTRDAAARLWPGQDAIGKRFRQIDDKNKTGAWVTVIGIAADMVQSLQENAPKPLIFVPYRQKGWDDLNSMTLMVESAVDPLQAMRRSVQSVDGELPLSEPARLKATIDEQVWFLNLFGKLFLAFALIGMLMAAVGIYAVVAHATGSRTQEIGVRIALGATMRSILMLVMRRGLLQIGIGLGVGLAATIPTMNVIESLQTGGLRADPMVVIAVAVTLAAVGVFACWLPARRAAGLDPVKAIRYE